MAKETAENFYTRRWLPDPDYTIGEHTYGRPRVYDWKEGSTLIIGDYSSIADDVVILLGGNHRTDWISTYPFPAFDKDFPSAKGKKGYSWTKGDVKIGSDVWIGNGAIIFSGVKIGNGAVIGARAVVTHDVPDFAIVGGSPAKVIKTRFTKKQIDQLQLIRWWDWPAEQVEDNLELLSSGDIEQLWQTSDHPPLPAFYVRWLKHSLRPLFKKLKMNPPIRWSKIKPTNNGSKHD